jgi:hypothetical protein
MEEKAGNYRAMLPPQLCGGGFESTFGEQNPL